MANREEKISQELEEILFGEEVGHEAIFDVEQMKISQDQFDRDQLLKELSYSIGYQELLRRLNEEAKRRREEEDSYSGLDEEKIKKLRQARILANHARDFVRDMVAGAVETLRPVLQKTQEEN